MALLLRNLFATFWVLLFLPQETAALYRHLAAVLRHCLLVNCEGEERKDELQG